MQRTAFPINNPIAGSRPGTAVVGTSAKAWLATLLVLLAAGPMPAAERQMLRWHGPAATANLLPVGRLAATNTLDLAIALPLRNQDALARLLDELYDPHSPNYQQYLTAEQVAERFGPSEEDYQALVAFAKANGFAIVETHPNRTLLHVKAAVPTVERTFHVTIRRYPHPKEPRTFYAPDAAPSVDLAIPILDVLGLENYDLPHPALKAMPLGQLTRVTANTGSGLSGTFLGNDFRNAYAPGVTLTGTGQRVALFEMDGYFTNDIAAYETAAGLPSVALTNVVLGGFDGTPVDPSAVVEVSLDIEMAIAMAPGLAQVIVYEAPLSSAGAYDILNRMATDNLAKQISSSWVIDRIVTNPVPSQIYQQYAAQGQSFFQASGDEGAYTQSTFQTADNPYITTVGGTTLTTAGPGGAWVSETVWSGSGGGISSGFAVPSYQQGMDMTASMGSTTMRNVPDVALTADNVEVIADEGEIFAVGGTSCAAPLWAGFTALINQQAAANGRLPIGFLNPALYALGQQAAGTLGLHDITIGNNTSLYSPNLFYAVPGYDLCTGWGTPNGSNLVNALVAPPDALEISPGLGFAAAGPPGGPFTPSAQDYVLKNAGPTPLNWTLVNTSSWLSVTATSGQLPPDGLPVIITASLNAVASNLLASTYTGEIRFTNLNNGFAQSRQFYLQVATVPPVIVAQSTNQNILAGGTASFSVRATGTDLHYYWQKNGTTLADGGPVSGSTNCTLTLNSVVLADAGIYSVLVSNAAGQITSAGAALVVQSPGGSQLVQNGGFETGTFAGWTLSGNTNLVTVTTNAYAIHSGGYGAQFGTAGALGFISQSVPTVPGSSYLVSVWVGSADGRAPNEFVVQWDGSTIFDAANLPAIGWTNLQFVVTASGASTLLGFGLRDNPSYLALDDVSVAAVTNTTSPPILTAQPFGQQVPSGHTASFNALAIGTSPLTYQWRLNGVNLTDGGAISGSATPQLTISHATAANIGTYSVTVSNNYGVAVSADATLVVLPPGALQLGFDDLPASGSRLTNGYGGLNWTNFVAIAGYYVDSMVGSSSGYSAGTVSPDNVVFNNGGQSACIASVAQPFNMYSAYLTAAWNDNLQVQALGYAGSNHLVFSNTYTLSATAPTLVQFNCTNVTEVDFTSFGGTQHPGYLGSGNHFVMDNLAISFVGPVTIAYQPQGQTIPVGNAATFDVLAVGSVPLSFHWQKNGVDLTDGGSISGSATSTLTVSNATFADAAVYSVAVSNSYGHATSAGAALAVYLAGAANLIQNGGFETGDFTGWTQLGDTNRMLVTTNAAAVHSGAYGAELGTAPTSFLINTIEQVLPTSPGASYQLSFWFKSLAGNNSYGSFSVYWDGNLLLADSNPGPSDGTLVQFPVKATEAGTLLEFSFQISLGYYALDDVSLNPITNMASPPVITVQPVGQRIPNGSSASFHVAATGATNLTYQWLLNGTNLANGDGIAGATTPTLTIARASDDYVGTYSVVVSNVFGSIASYGAPLSLLPPGELLITFDDLPETLYGLIISNGYQGLSWTNLYYVDGLNTLNYQPGAAMAVISPNNVAYGETPCGISSSSPFGVHSVYLTAAYSVDLPIAVLGYSGHTLLYSNYYTLQDTSPTLVDLNYTNITELDFASIYYYSTLMLDNLAVSFAGPVTILTSPVSQAIAAGDSAAFSASAVGSAPMTFQWFKNGMPLSDGGGVEGAATSALTFSDTTSASAGVYSVVVSNAYGAVTSAGAALTVYLTAGGNVVRNGGFETDDFSGWSWSGNTKSSSVTSNTAYVHTGSCGAQLGPSGSSGTLLQNLPTTPGTAYLLSLYLANPGAGGYNSFYVYWNGSAMFDQSTLPPSGWTRLTFPVTAGASSTELRFSFENDLGYFALDDVNVSPLAGAASPPTITGEPLSQVVSPGATAIFTVTATPQPLNYQWRVNGTNLIDGLYISGSTSAVLTVRNVSAARVGTYSVVVTNLYGLAVSADAILQMGVPTIAADPVAQSVPLGATATFSVSASGLGPLSYHWRLNGVNLGNGGNVSGATAPVLTITNVATPNIGTYSAIVSNPYGAATSAVAVLSVYLLGDNNLVQNGGFETGDFTGWNASGSLKDLMVSGNAFYVHSGQFGAQLGPYEYTSLYQYIPTSPGGQYLLSLWLHPDGQGWFGASWNTSTVFPSATLPAGGWTNLQFLVAASGDIGYLSFQFEDTAAYLGLDDVSVNNCTLLNAPAPVPVQILSPHVTNGTFAFSFSTLLGQSYTIQENTDLATTNWLLCTNLTGSGALYQFSVPVGGSATRTMFRVREP